jgi:hypothetical protein
VILTENQIAALEKAKSGQGSPRRVRHRVALAIAAPRTYVGTLKGVGRIYQQTFVDTYCKVAFAKLYDRKTPITAADLLKDWVIPFFDEHGVSLQRLLTDHSTEFCGAHDRHEYELYLVVENIGHTRTKTKSRQTNGIVDGDRKKQLYGVQSRPRNATSEPTSPTASTTWDSNRATSTPNSPTSCGPRAYPFPNSCECPTRSFSGSATSVTAASCASASSGRGAGPRQPPACTEQLAAGNS